MASDGLYLIAFAIASGVIGYFICQSPVGECIKMLATIEC